MIENARIISTQLGFPDKGIATAWITLEGNGWGCGFGGYALDKWDETQNDRIDIPLFGWFVRRVLETLKVDTWEEVKGKLIRAEVGRCGESIPAIGHIIEDRWFRPREEIEEYLCKQSTTTD